MSSFYWISNCWMKLGWISSYTFSFFINPAYLSWLRVISYIKLKQEHHSYHVLYKAVTIILRLIEVFTSKVVISLYNFSYYTNKNLNLRIWVLRFNRVDLISNEIWDRIHLKFFFFKFLFLFLVILIILKDSFCLRN